MTAAKLAMNIRNQQINELPKFVQMVASSQDLKLVEKTIKSNPKLILAIYGILKGDPLNKILKKTYI